MNDKQSRFVSEYIKDQNASQAAIRAGYSKNGAGQSAHNLLKNTEIREAIDKRLKRIAEMNDTSVGAIIKKLNYVATYSSHPEHYHPQAVVAACREMSEVLNYKPKQKIELSGAPGLPIAVAVGPDLSHYTREELDRFIKLNEPGGDDKR